MSETTDGFDLPPQEYGEEVLYRASVGLERAMVAPESRAWLNAYAERIPDNWDPDRVLTRNIPYLAWGMGVTLWYDDWDEPRKRRWLRGQWIFKAKVGTEVGIRMALDVVDAVPLQFVRPPQGMFYSGKVDPAVRQAYLDRLPEIRIYWGRRTRPYDGGLVWGTSEPMFWGDSFYTPDFGPEMYGRRATFVYKGVEEEMQHTLISVREEGGTLTNYETIVRRGKPGEALFYGDDASAWAASYWNALEVRPLTYTLGTDGTYTVLRASARTQVIAPGFEPLYPDAQRGSRFGDAGLALMFNGDFWGVGPRFWIPDDAEDLVFTKIKLFDPDEPAPLAPFGDFYNDARYGMPMFTAEVLIEATREAAPSEMFYGEDFYADSAYTPPDFTKQDRAARAVEVSKALRDRVLYSFETTRTRTLSDTIPIDGTYNFRNRLRRYL